MTWMHIMLVNNVVGLVTWGVDCARHWSWGSAGIATCHALGLGVQWVGLHCIRRDERIADAAARLGAR